MKEAYPLLQSQLGVLLQSMQHPESTQYNLPNYIFMPLSMKRERVVATVQSLIASFPVLHTRFVAGEQGEIRQWCDKSMTIPVVSRKCSEEELQTYLSDGFVRPFSLFGSESLFRVEVIETEKRLCLLSDGHHAIVDGMSFAPILTSAFAKIYEGGTIEVPSYGMYQAAEDEAESFATEAYPRAKAYYAQKFAGIEMATLSRGEYGVMGAMGRNTAVVSRQACDDWCSEHGVQANLLFQAAFSHVLSVLTRQQQVAYAAVNHGRMDRRLRSCVGMFVKSVPILVDADPACRVVDFVKSLRGELMSTIRHGIYPFTHFCSDLGMKPGIIFDFMAVADMEEHVMLSDGEMCAVQPVRKEVDSDLSVDIYLRGENYEIRVQSSLAMNDAQTIQMVAEAVRVAICNMMAHPEATLGELDIVSDEERDALIQLGKGKHLDIDPQMTFVKAFEQQAIKTPDSLAVADIHDSMTYGELSRRSDILAHRLIECGVKPGDFVAVMLDRTIAFPLAVIAIHKAGAAYVPIDLDYPEERKQYMLDHSQAKLVVDDQFVAETDFTVSGETAGSIDLSTPGELAYMIYTSGSTGRPKGVMIRQANLWNFIQNFSHVTRMTADDRVAAHRSFSFDAHLKDLYSVLTKGGSLHIMPEHIRRDLHAIRQFIIDHQITVAGFTTTLGMLVLDTFDDLPIRLINMGGERLHDVYSDHIVIVNCYGPTECTDDIFFYRIEPGQRFHHVPIGQPVSNGHCFLVDTQGRLVPRGAVGELCFAGVQVAIGYWRQPELTAEKFTDCPFLLPPPSTFHLPPFKMYHTGDLCRWSEEGLLEYVGRKDDQVKLRGFRIEFGEVESRATRFEGIREAVAIVKKLAGSDTLCLYYTSAEPDTTVDASTLRRFMAQTLAEYMVPATYTQLDALPRTPSGKVDRRQLPEPHFTPQSDYVAPQTKAEETLARLMSDVLSLSEPVSMTDSFFALGGDSIKLIRLVTMLHNEGFTTQISELMQCSTVHDMARQLATSSDSPAISQEPVDGPITPGAIQQRFLSSHLPHSGCFTQSVVLRALQPINASLLQQVLQALTVHHDMMRACVVNGTIVIRPTTDDHLFAFAEKTLQAHDKVTHAISETIHCEAKLIDLEHGPTLRTVLLHTADGDRLLMVCHHIACDGVSWRILTDDLTTALTQLASGHPISLPPKTHAFGYWTDMVARYRDSYLLAKEKPYWQRTQTMMENMALTRVDDSQRIKRQLMVTLEGEPLRQLLTTSVKAYNTEINELLITALCLSYHRLTGSTDLTLQMQGHGREPLHEPVVTDRTVGWFTSVYPVIISGISGDVRSDIRHVKELLRAVPNKGIGYGILQYIPSQMGDAPLRTDLTPLMGFNYLGEATDSGGNDLFTVDESLFLSEGLMAGYSVTVNCAIVERRFVARFEYDTASWTDEKAQQLADGFIDSIAQVAQHTSQVTVSEPTASDFGADGWTEQQFQDIVEHFATQGETLQRVYPLTPLQEGMLVSYLSDPDTTAYRLLFRLSMSMLPTEAMLRPALDYLAEKHEVLRTAILYDGVPQPCQAIVSRQPRLEMFDLTGETDIDAAAARIHQEQLHRPLSLTDDSLFRIVCMKTGNNSCQLLVFIHHIIADGWCNPIIFRDFLMKMEAEADGKPLTNDNHQQGRYETFVRQLLRRDRKTALAYWKKLLADYDTRADIPSYGKTNKTKANPLVRHIFDKALTAQLRQLAATTSVTLNTVLELGWGLMLQSFCRTGDAVFLRVVSGRNSSTNDQSQLVGLCINSVPVRVRTAPTDTVAQSLKFLQAQAAQSAIYDFCPLSDIQQQTGLGNQSLYQSVMAFENYPLGDTLLSASRKWTIKPVQIEEEAFGELAVTISPEADGTLRLAFTYDTSLYGELQIQQLAETFETIVRNMAAMSDRPISELPLITEEAKAELVELGRGEQLDFDHKDTLVSLFRRQAAATPDATAVVFGDRRMTYGELDQMTDRLACHLINTYHVQPEEAVGVMIDRSELMVVYPLAIMKAGGCYMPLDYSFPAERLQYMCNDAGVRLILSERLRVGEQSSGMRLRVGEQSSGMGDRVNEAMPDFMGDIVTYDILTSLPVCTLQLPSPLPQHRFVILYTSGSTGHPKGVALEQHSIVNFCHWYMRFTGISASDRMAMHAAFGFDCHMMEMFPALMVGATLYVIPSEMRLEIGAINTYFEQNVITMAFMTTQVGHLFASNVKNHSLRMLCVAGEKLMPLKYPGYRVVNGYGPTEATVLTTCLNIDADYDRPNIGRPLCGYQVYVVDSNMRLLPRGVAGELLICGEGVARGYLHPTETDAVRFFTLSGQRAYRTGDLVRWADDGNLDYLGRTDNQVKLRGLRIEMGEIEACASQFAGMCQVVAQTVNGQHICLYYTADADIDVNALKQYLANRLAVYMIPAAYMQLEELPLTPNGKVDRRRLPAVDATQLLADYVAPESELEKLIVSGFEKVLNQEKIGVNDDFVRLGGDSLDALKLVYSLGERGITVADVLSLRTPAAIASNARRISVNLNKYSIKSGCPLNNSQMFIFNDIVKFNKYDSYLMPFVIPIDRKYSDEQIRNALDIMFTAHPVLTMHVAQRDGVPYMEKGDKPEVMKGSLNPLKILSFLTSGFDLYSSLSRHVIVRIPGRCYLVSVVHHLIFDRISQNVFYRHFQRALEGASLGFVDDHFLKVSAFHQEVKSTEQYAETDKYIRAMLNNLSEANFYMNPGKHGRPGYHKCELGVDRGQVDQFTKRFSINKNILFTAAMAMTLSKLAGSDDVAFGFLDNGRDRFNNFEDIGLYMNGMPIVAHVDLHDMGAFLEHLADVYYKLSQNSYFPFASLVQEFNIAPIILFQFFPDWITEDGKYDHLPHNETLINAVVSTQKDFMVEALANVIEMGNSYTFRITYSGYYSRKMMKKLAKTYKETIIQIVKSEERKICYRR